MRRLWLCALLCGCGKITLAPDDAGGVVDLAGGDAAFVDLAVDGGDGGARPPTVAIAATPDLVGFVTQLDGSGSTDPLGRTLTYAWHFTSVPTGSAVADASLSSPTDPKPTFEPDRGGAYVVQLTVRAPDGSTVSDSKMFTVPTVPLFFSEATFTTASTLTDVAVIQSDGTGKKVLSCIQSFDGGVAMGASNKPGNGAIFAGLYSLDWFTPATGTAQVAFMEQHNDGDAPLLVASADGDCTAKPPVRLDNAGDATYHTTLKAGARFSPDGKHVAWIENPNNANARLVTNSTDGASYQIVHAPTGGPVVQSVRPAWVDSSTVAWVELNGTSLTVQKANNASNASPTILYTCSTTDSTNLVHIDQIEFASSAGTLIAGNALPATNGVDPTIEVYRMGTTCIKPANLSRQARPGGIARDFVVSPDGLNVIFSANQGDSFQDGGGAAAPLDLWTVGVDGINAPLRFAGTPLHDDVGPRFVAGGRQVAWTQTLRTTRNDLGVLGGGGLMIANVDGTHVRSLAAPSGDVNVGTAVLGGTSLGGFTLACAWAGGVAAASGFSGALLCLLSLALPRLLRRKRS
jgi:hypothetical protein